MIQNTFNWRLSRARCPSVTSKVRRHNATIVLVHLPGRERVRFQRQACATASFSAGLASLDAFCSFWRCADKSSDSGSIHVGPVTARERMDPHMAHLSDASSYGGAAWLLANRAPVSRGYRIQLVGFYLWTSGRRELAAVYILDKGTGSHFSRPCRGHMGGKVRSTPSLFIERTGAGTPGPTFHLWLGRR